MQGLTGARRAFPTAAARSLDDATLDETLAMVRDLQGKLGQGPDIDEHVAQAAYVLVHSGHFEPLVEWLMDITYRQRPPMHGTMDEAAMALTAYQARCALMDLLFGVAAHHERSLKTKKEHKP